MTESPRRSAPGSNPTTSTTSQLLGRGSIYTLATAAPILAALAITPLLTRALRQTEYGYVSLGITVLQFTVNLMAMGLPTAITRHAIVGGTGPEGARGVAAQGALIALVVSAIASLIGLTVSLTVSCVPLALLLAVLTGGAGAGIAMAQALCLAEDRPWRYVGFAFGMSLAAPAAGLLAVWLVSDSSSVYFAALCLGYLMIDAAAYVQIARTRAVRCDRRDFRAALGFALPMIPHQLAVGLTTAVAVWIATITMGVDAAAEAQPSLQLATMPLVITSALSYAWTPIVLRAKLTERGPLLEETATVVAWLAGLGGSVVALCAPWVLRFLTPFDLANMVPLTAVASPTAAIAAAYLAHLQLVVAEGATRPLAILSPIAVLIGALCASLLVNVLSLTAVAVGYLVTYSLLYVFTRLVARRASPVRWRERSIAWPILLSGTLCLAGSLLDWESLLATVVRLGLSLIAAAIALRIFIMQLRGQPRHRL